MGQKKLERFAEIGEFPNVLQYPKDMQGAWGRFFKNDNPILLELACGKGEYAVGLGRMFPQNNYIGVDLKGNRIWVGAKQALREGLANIAFVRSQIDVIDHYFNPGEVSEIWITFPDPQLRTSRAKKRLTHPKFLRLYQKILKPGGHIHLKTDSPTLYSFTKLVIDMYRLNLHSDIEDVYGEDEIDPALEIKTHYENLDIANSKRVHYLRFSLPDGNLPDKDNELKEILREEEADRRT
jgi:tRNA (guanine-N7-)-methyltransferase